MQKQYRIYEISKSLKTSSEILLRIAHKLGIRVKMRTSIKK